jgi:hypothetical protein
LSEIAVLPNGIYGRTSDADPDPIQRPDPFEAEPRYPSVKMSGSGSEKNDSDPQQQLKTEEKNVKSEPESNPFHRGGFFNLFKESIM